jgi:hypothetical protein
MAVATDPRPCGAPHGDLPIFSGDTDLCEAHERMEDIRGDAVWMNDFTPTRTAHKRLINCLLRYLKDEDICCAIAGFFPAYLSGRFEDMPFAGLYIASCVVPKSQLVRHLLFLTPSRNASR